MQVNKANRHVLKLNSNKYAKEFAQSTWGAMKDVEKKLFEDTKAAEEEEAKKRFEEEQAKAEEEAEEEDVEEDGEEHDEL